MIKHRKPERAQSSFTHLNLAPNDTGPDNDGGSGSMLAQELLFELINLACIKKQGLADVGEDVEEYYESLSCDEFLIYASDYEDTSLLQFTSKFAYLDEKPLVQNYLSSERVSAQDLSLPDHSALLL